MSFESTVITLIATVIASAIGGIFSYIITKKSDLAKNRIKHREESKSVVLDKMKDCLHIHEITVTNFSLVLEDIKRIRDLIYIDPFLLPPKIINQFQELNELISSASPCPSDQWDLRMKKDIISRYRSCRYTFSLFEKEVRAVLGYPEDTPFENVKYDTGTPILMITLAIVSLISWTTPVVVYTIMDQQNNLAIYCIISLVALASICIITRWWNRRKRIRFLKAGIDAKSKKDEFC